MKKIQLNAALKNNSLLVIIFKSEKYKKTTKSLKIKKKIDFFLTQKL